MGERTTTDASIIQGYKILLRLQLHHLTLTIIMHNKYIETERKETKGNRVNNLKRRIRNSQLPQGTALLLSSQLDSAVKRCSLVKGLAQRD